MLQQPTPQGEPHSTWGQKHKPSLHDSPTGQLNSPTIETACSLDDIARISCGSVTQRQQSAPPQTAASHSTERKQQLRRQLVRNKL